MKYRSVAVVSLLAMAGCSTANEHYRGSQVVVIDGEEYMARKTPTSKGDLWMSTPNAPTLASLFSDPIVYARNARAIEKASGCHIVRNSVQNGNSSTYAEVDCSSAPSVP